MAKYLLRNSLNPGKVVECSITFRQIVNKGDEGEPVWLVEINTAEPHKDGGNIVPAYVHLTSLNNLDEEIRDATEEIAAQVDWEPLLDDDLLPYISYNSPTEGDTDVDIYSNVIIDIKDDLPSAGIDISSIQVIINEFDVTSDVDITGDPYEYRLEWAPDIRVLDYYDP